MKDQDEKLSLLLDDDSEADVMDCPIGTVRSRIFRARDVIDKELRPLLE